MMHRTHTAGLLALALPGALALHPLLAVPVTVGLWRTRTWTAWGAAGLGVAMLWPWTLLVSAGVGLLVAASSWDAWTMHRQTVRGHGSPGDRWLPHGAGLDGLRARLLSWVYLCRTWSWRGRDTRLALEAAHIRSGWCAMEGGPARNEFLQLAYSYGLLGVLAVTGCAALALPRLHVGDPLSATLVTAAAVLAGTSPVMALRRWFTGGDGPLFGPPLRASLSVHLDATGQVHLFGAESVDHRASVDVARALATACEAWMRSHDVTLDEIATP
jgi:hypothetical protein